jgi:hypothetical protein
MSAGARIGFHVAYSDTTGQVTGVGNALIGAYLNRIPEVRCLEARR